MWSIGITDVSFLLALRKSNRLTVAKPPSILVEAGLMSAEWAVEAAVYGLRFFLA